MPLEGVLQAGAGGAAWPTWPGNPTIERAVRGKRLGLGCLDSAVRGLNRECNTFAVKPQLMGKGIEV